LSHNKRPDFVPPSGLTLKDVSAAIAHLEECEQERRVALHAELNRQIRLLQTDEQHKEKHEQLSSWLAEKEAYLKKKEEIDTVSKAHLHLRLLDAYDKESVALQNSSVSLWYKQADELVAQKYERSDEVTSRTSAAKEKFVTLGELSAQKRPVLQDDLARETFKENTRLKNNQHLDIYSQLLSWHAEKEAYLRNKEEIHSVKEAQEQLSLLDGYDQEEQGVTESSVAYLKNLGADILAAKYHTSYSSWVFEEPDELRSREADIDSKWKVLGELSAEKRRVLDDDLARETFADAVRSLNRNHVDKYNKLNTWIAEKKQYLHRKEEVDTISKANIQLSLLEAYNAEKSNRAAANVKALKTLGAEILAKEYKTDYSSWVYETPDDLKARESEIDSHWVELGQLYEAKKKVLEDDLAREIEKERLRIEFAHLASDFVVWTKDTATNLAATHFGFSLPEVEEFKATLDSENAAINAEAEQKKAAYEEIFNHATNLGVTENVYTKLSLEDLAKARGSLNDSLAARNDAYAKELARQQANDALCHKFAQLVEPLSKWIVEQKDKITQSKEPLDDQLQHVESRTASADTDGASLNEIQTLEEQIEAAGITNNRHTNLSFKDVQVQFDQYKQFLHSKKKMLEDEIQQEKLKGITASELKEIEDNFQQFDSGSKSHLDKRELKACLYSLGEEKTRAELEEIVKQYGNGSTGTTPYEGFKAYMIAVLGVSDTKEDILNSFATINKADNPGQFEQFSLVMNDHDLAYLKGTAPALGSGFDFRVWTEEVFAR
jgi:Ca2+-binding EF-hand superfamily protein